MNAGGHFYRSCYDSGICASLAVYLSKSPGSDKAARTVIEHCVDVFSPLTSIPVDPSGKVQCVACVAERLNDMSGDGYA